MRLKNRDQTTLREHIPNGRQSCPNGCRVMRVVIDPVDSRKISAVFKTPPDPREVFDAADRRFHRRSLGHRRRDRRHGVQPVMQSRNLQVDDAHICAAVTQYKRLPQTAAQARRIVPVARHASPLGILSD